EDLTARSGSARRSVQRDTQQRTAQHLEHLCGRPGWLDIGALQHFRKAAAAYRALRWRPLLDNRADGADELRVHRAIGAPVVLVRSGVIAEQNDIRVEQPLGLALDRVSDGVEDLLGRHTAAAVQKTVEGPQDAAGDGDSRRRREQSQRTVLLAIQLE